MTCTTFYYLVRRVRGRQPALDALKEVTAVFEIVPVDGQLIRAALGSAMTDFEDAVQAFCAQAAGASHIVTRDLTDFAGSPVPAVGPDELLASL